MNAAREEPRMFIITRARQRREIYYSEAYNFISESNYIEININFPREKFFEASGNILSCFVDGTRVGMIASLVDAAIR